MGGLALLARDMGHKVSGSDIEPYPPMSTLLAEQNIIVSKKVEQQSESDTENLLSGIGIVPIILILLFVSFRRKINSF